MIQNDGSGWAEIRIGNFHDVASYITPVPLDCLNAFINCFRDSLPACIQFDAEKYRYILIATWDETLICVQNNSACDYVVRCEVNVYQLANEIIKDIEGDTYGWATFLEEEDDDIERVNRTLKDKVNELKSYIKSDRYNAFAHCYLVQ